MISILVFISVALLTIIAFSVCLFYENYNNTNNNDNKIANSVKLI